MIDKQSSFEEPNIPFGFDNYIDVEKLLAEYLDIDLEEAEKERMELIKNLK